MNPLFTHEATKAHHEELRRRANRRTAERQAVESAQADAGEPVSTRRFLPARPLFSR